MPDYSPNDVFNEDYFMDGISKGISCYENYTWRPELTVPMAKRFLDYLDIRFGDYILDLGCSRGYFVRALMELGKIAYGVDISEWAISNCDPAVKGRVSTDLRIKPMSVDWINAKDVLEHIKYDELSRVVCSMVAGARQGIFIIVPLVETDGGDYLRPEDQKDVTHQIRWTLEKWLKFLQALAPDFIVNGSYHIPDLKAASQKVPYSCGFFTLRRFR
jgi:hypothetical protein